MGSSTGLKVGTKLIVLPNGDGEGCPEIHAGELCVVSRVYENEFDYTIGEQIHTGWNASLIGNYFAIKKNPTIIVGD
jgi:predicted kinase